jgi:hypothetical protein
MKINIHNLDDEWYRVLPIAGIMLSIIVSITSIIELKNIYKK